MSRSLRPRALLSYYEPDEPELDQYVFCEYCADFVFEYCAIHGPLLIVPDDKVPVKHKFPACVPRAALTIPHVFLHLNYSTIPGAGLGVFSTLTLPKGVRFGPYRGVRTARAASDYCWQIYGPGRKPSHVVDASDGNRSNWMRFVNCSRSWPEQNLVAYQYQGELYYRTIKIIPRYTELLVFYGSEYANNLNIDLAKYNAPKCYAQKFGAPAPKKALTNVKTSDEPQLRKVNNTGNEVIQEQNKTQNSQKDNNDPENGGPPPKKSKTNVKKPDKALTGKKQNKENEDIRVKKKTQKKKKETELKAEVPLTKKRKMEPVKDPQGKNDRTTCKKTDKKLTETVLSKDLHTASNNNEEIISKTINPENIQKSNNSPDITKIEIVSPNNGPVKICPKDVYFICDVCKYQTITKNILKRHMNLHDVNRKFSCDTCSYRLRTNDKLIQHKRSHGNGSAQMYKCDICNFLTIHQRSLKLHLRIHTEEKPFSCNVCSYKCNKASNLKRHLRIHTGEKPFSCNVCSYKCNHASHLKTHLRIHTGEKPFSCNVCTYKCNNASHLKTHLRIHTGEKPFSCNVCSYKCNEASTLKTHLRTHTGEKPFSCNVCSYKCNRASILKDHLRIHTGEKPFSCNVCCFKCNQTSILKRHIKIHTGEKSFSCNVCSYKCTRADNLKDHLRIHTGEKPYSCDICNYKCITSSKLKNHLKSKHLR